MTTRKLRPIFVKTVIVEEGQSIAEQTFGYLRGQWVFVNGMMGRVANHTGNRVLIWLAKEKTLACFG